MGKTTGHSATHGSRPHLKHCERLQQIFQRLLEAAVQALTLAYRVRATSLEIRLHQGR